MVSSGAGDDDTSNEVARGDIPEVDILEELILEGFRVGDTASAAGGSTAVGEGVAAAFVSSITATKFPI